MLTNMTDSPDTFDDLLRSLVGRAYNFEQVQLEGNKPTELAPSLTGAEVDDLLLDAEHQGLVVGNRTNYGDTQNWSQLRLTVGGLRWLGEWPPPGLEHHDGPWDDGHYGAVVKPVLADLRDHPPRHGLVIAPVWGMPEEKWERWRALELLLEAGLISGRVTTNGESLDDIRLTPAGRQALDRSERDPLDTAARKLRTGSKIEAMIIAVEKAVGPRLKELATAASIPIDQNGRALKLSAINNQLKTAGVLTESERVVVESMLKRRNDCSHGDDERVSYAQAEVVIAEARVFLEEHPVT
jgi:hypothetical protein